MTGLHQLVSPVERRFQSGGQWSVPFQDGIHIAYLDCSQADDSPLGKLLHDFCCNQASDIFYPELREKVQYFKGTDKGVAIMCDLMEEYLKKEREEGKGDVIVNMLKEHMRLDLIERLSGWTDAEIRALAQKNGLAVE